MEERAPKYYILKKVLEEKIENEEFPADEPIPSEQELMEMYQDVYKRQALHARLCAYSEIYR